MTLLFFNSAGFLYNRLEGSKRLYELFDFIFDGYIYSLIIIHKLNVNLNFNHNGNTFLITSSKKYNDRIVIKVVILV